MIKENTIIFGYGDIGVHIIPSKSTMTFNQLNNNFEIGTDVSYDESIAINNPNNTTIEFNDLDDVYALESCLREVINANGAIVTFGNLRLDFNINYKRESVDVVLHGLDSIKTAYIRLCAC